MAVVLGDKHTLLRLGVEHGSQRSELSQIVGTDDHATGMYAYLADSIL